MKHIMTFEMKNVHLGYQKLIQLSHQFTKAESKNSMRYNMKLNHNIEKFTVYMNMKSADIRMFKLIMKKFEHRIISTGKGSISKRKRVASPLKRQCKSYFEDLTCKYEPFINLVNLSKSIYEADSQRTDKKTGKIVITIGIRLIFDRVHQIRSLVLYVKNPALICDHMWKAMERKGFYSDHYDDGLETAPLPAIGLPEYRSPKNKTNKIIDHK